MSYKGANLEWEKGRQLKKYGNVEVHHIIEKRFTERIGTGSNKIRGIAKQCVNEFRNDLKTIYSLATCTLESDMLLARGM